MIFAAGETFVITGRGRVFVGPCPWDNLRDRANFKPLIGTKIMVLFEGETREYEIVGFEAFGREHGPKLGSTIGMLVKP